ncbi:hypothetical protein F4811DRAFT_300724 [Daldinia bambusicola]|nr:hypothetical protein F4811DRAFT_300724 [Daldinia bambusicola]
MLLRQLHRPSSRSVAAAAAVAWQWQWQASHTALLHNSTSRLQPQPPPPSHTPPQDTPTPRDTKDQDQDKKGKGKDARPKKSKNRPSLFEQLFPDDAKTLLNKNTAPKPSWAEHLLDDPPQPPSPSPTIDEENLNQDSDNNDHDKKSPADVPLRAKSMLILSAASKHLTESDFLRLGPQGAHVEGWVGGLSRVIQARDPDTLQALGHYFVLFDREAAAAAYCDEVERLWQLGKAHVPGAHHRKKRRTSRHPTSPPTPPSVPPPPGLPAADGSSQDVAADLRAFTLVPPSQRYYLDVSSGLGRVRIEELDVGGGVAFIDRLADRAGSRHLVLVAVDGGRMSVDWLRQAIEEDGRERNLPWGVTSLERGILPFGKSVLKKQMDDREQEQEQQPEQQQGEGEEQEEDGSFEGGLLDQAERITGKPEWLEGQSDGVGEKGAVGGDDGGSRAAREEGGARKEDDDRKYRRYPRFIVPFVDNAEAHRFVRHWHRRHFKVRMSLAGEKPISWDETRILNTTVLW